MQKNLEKKLSIINYPRIDLPYSLEKTKQLAKQIGDQVLAEIEIAKKMGYIGLTGRAIAVVSALKKYRLLEKQASGFKVSQLAKKIFDPNSSIETRTEALQEAAFSPAIFARIFERFENRLPSTNELDEFLETQNIIKPTRKRITKNYQKTFEFAVGQGNDFWLYQGALTSIPSAKGNSFGSLSPVLDGQQHSKRISERATGTDDNTGYGSGQALIFPLVGNVIAKITFSHKIEGRHLESLIQYLQLHKSQNFPEKS